MTNLLLDISWPIFINEISQQLFGISNYRAEWYDTNLNNYVLYYTYTVTWEAVKKIWSQIKVRISHWEMYSHRTALSSSVMIEFSSTIRRKKKSYELEVVILLIKFESFPGTAIVIIFNRFIRWQLNDYLHKHRLYNYRESEEFRHDMTWPAWLCSNWKQEVFLC